MEAVLNSGIADNAGLINTAYVRRLPLAALREPRFWDGGACAAGLGLPVPAGPAKARACAHDCAAGSSGQARLVCSAHSRNSSP